MIAATKQRVFGCDVPFLNWLRKHPELKSKAEGISATDTDVIVHKFASDVMDAQARRDGSTRHIQAIMGIEVKTRGGLPDFAQQDTLYKWHLTTMRRANCEGFVIRNFGWSFVQLSGTSPADSAGIRWGRFKDFGEIGWTLIDEALLVDLIAFRRHPDNFEKQIFRRHHKTQNIWRIEQAPLGFTVPVQEVRRS